MDKSAAIEKVKLLLRLAGNTTENEANAAKTMAEKLIARHELTEEEYTEKEIKPIYSDNDLIFEEIIPIEWRQTLALVCGNKFDCYVIKEENKNLINGDCVYCYFVYGHEEDVILTKMLFQNVSEQIENLAKEQCKDKNALYISSFYEGAVNGARTNIEYEDFDVSGMVKKSDIPQIEMKDSKALEKVKEPKKEQPIEATAPVYKDEKPIDIYAYLAGEKVALDKVHIGKLDPLKSKWLEMQNEIYNEDKEEDKGLWNTLAKLLKSAKDIEDKYSDKDDYE